MVHNTRHRNVTLNLTKWWHFVATIVPVVGLIISAMFWMDVRYMHKEISDNRHIELQYKIVTVQMNKYHQMQADKIQLTPAQITAFKALEIEFIFLETERNKLMGIGGSQ